MAVEQSLQTTTPQLLDGTWHVDPKPSQLTFKVRSVFGLVPVRGSFNHYEGELQVDGSNVSGELRIEAATLDTKHEKRDAHLRSEDFFHVDMHPTVTFSLTDLAPSEDGTVDLVGTLQIRDRQVQVHTPVEITRLDADHIRLDTKLRVDRAAAGLDWNKLGMIQGKAHLGGSIVLVRI
jgi:polyisoprenoid-binding protein YceI